MASMMHNCLIFAVEPAGRRCLECGWVWPLEDLDKAILRDVQEYPVWVA